jgi:single-stranded-DNA-specific exonuclease
MLKSKKKWMTKNDSVVNSVDDVVHILLKNRKIQSGKSAQFFLNPPDPSSYSLTELGIAKKSVDNAIEIISSTIAAKGKVIVYGDYDADGVCATAILWETMRSLGADVLPFIPNRFDHGYGVSVEGIDEIVRVHENVSLIITVDNGIVAHEAISYARKKGIRIIITDHHQKALTLPKADAIVHTDKICGSAVAWVFANELSKSLASEKNDVNELLELAAVGTIADQMELIGVNRSIAKHGIDILRKTRRIGLLALYNDIGIDKRQIGTYEINYLIAPRINAMGRLTDAMDSLRLLCTKDTLKAKSFSQLLAKTNTERQKIVEESLSDARANARNRIWNGVVIVSSTTYHEGVIGLIASKLVEEYWLPSIVISQKEGISKASARSIPGFNIIETIREASDLIEGGGGHPMAAGFSIKTDNITSFIETMQVLSEKKLTEEIKTRKLSIDLILPFAVVSKELLTLLKNLEPTGIGNPKPLFVTYGVSIVDMKFVGIEKKHVKLSIESEGTVIDGIAFSMKDTIENLESDIVDIVYSVDENMWNGKSTLQLVIKDIREHDNKKDNTTKIST